MNFSLLHSWASSPLHTQHTHKPAHRRQLFFQLVRSHHCTVPKGMSWWWLWWWWWCCAYVWACAPNPTRMGIVLMQSIDYSCSFAESVSQSAIRIILSNMYLSTWSGWGWAAEDCYSNGMRGISRCMTGGNLWLIDFFKLIEIWFFNFIPARRDHIRDETESTGIWIELNWAESTANNVGELISSHHNGSPRVERNCTHNRIVKCCMSLDSSTLRILY